MIFLSSWDNFLQDTWIIFQKGVDNFEIEHKACLFLIRGAVPILKICLNPFSSLLSVRCLDLIFDSWLLWGDSPVSAGWIRFRSNICFYITHIFGIGTCILISFVYISMMYRWRWRGLRRKPRWFLMLDPDGSGCDSRLLFLRHILLCTCCLPTVIKACISLRSRSKFNVDILRFGIINGVYFDGV